ncbi:MAG: cell division protein SepF [Acidaminococcaceae bacterium]|nr:cell division protein SepF [Acidaminococcaceae bacterium]
MKIIEKIMEAMNLYDEEEEILEEEEPVNKKSLFASKKTDAAVGKGQAGDVPGKSEGFASSLFARKSGDIGQDTTEKRTVRIPVENKLVNVIVIEPVSFDDSQKIADHLRGNEPVVVNFEGTDGVVARRMTDFISGSVYAMGGTMKKLGRSIVICAPKNVNIDSGIEGALERGRTEWNRQ